MGLGDFVKAILRFWLVIVALGIVGAIVGYGTALFSPSMYRSTSSILVTSDRGESTSELVQGSAYVESLVATYVVLVRSEIVLQPVIDDLELNTSPQSLAEVITVDSPLNTVIIDISAVSEDPAVAQQFAAAVTRSLARVVTGEVSPTAMDGTATVRLTTIQSANLPQFAYSPSKRLNTLLGGLGGAALGVILAVGRSLLSHSIRTKRDVAQATTTPVVGEVVGTPPGVTLPAALLNDPQGNQAESVRSLAVNLSFLKVGDRLRSLVVTSASPGEAKSSIVASLGLTIAETQRVLLVDGDLRRPSLAALTQLEGAVGLTNVLVGEISLEDAVQPWSKNGLDVLTAGALPPNPAQMLASDAMRDLIAVAQEKYDLVIIDSGPALSVADAKWLGHMTDGAVIVSRYGRTSTRSLRRVIDAMQAATVPVLGVIISSLPRAARARYGDPYREVPGVRPVSVGDRAGARFLLEKEEAAPQPE